MIDAEKQKELLKLQLANRWLDPVKRAEDIFNIKTSKGDIIPFKCPEPQKEILRDGPLGNAKKLIDQGFKYQTVTDKGRQIGFSTITGIENILMAEDYPNTTLYYIADDLDQTKDYLDKVTQLSRDANHWPEELGGGPILNIQDLRPVYTKTINNTTITGLSGRAKGGKRGKNSVYVVWDEMAWCISVHNEQEEIWDVINHYLRQGGCVRMQSTPRTTDDKFWKFYTKSKDYGIKAYYKPTIENWRDLDLKQPLYIDIDNERRKLKQVEILKEEDVQRLIEVYKVNPRFEVDFEKKEIRQKNVKIPYPWVMLEELEKERMDYEKFLQENLGVSVDEKYKVIPSEWIYRNVTLEAERDTREGSKNPFYILGDIAQVNDITAITIVEKMPDGTIIERKLDSTQDKYDVQAEIFWAHFLNFKPQAISIDNTGHGRVVGDLIEAKLRTNSYPISILNRVNFSSTEKEVMAEGFRRLVQSDKYKFLNRTTLHAQSIRHVERVEKEVLETNVRYGGKKWGRDDFFWSKAQIVYFTQLLMPTPPSAFGKLKREIYDTPTAEKIRAAVTIEGIKEEIEKEEKPIDFRGRVVAKNIGRAILEFKHGIVDCPKTKKVEKPILCTGCDNKQCLHWDSMEKVCGILSVEKDVVWEKQRSYPHNFHKEVKEGIEDEQGRGR